MRIFPLTNEINQRGTIRRYKFLLKSIFFPPQNVFLSLPVIELQWHLSRVKLTKLNETRTGEWIPFSFFFFFTRVPRVLWHRRRTAEIEFGKFSTWQVLIIADSNVKSIKIKTNEFSGNELIRIPRSVPLLIFDNHNIILGCSFCQFSTKYSYSVLR